jgi:TatD DNase family protein
MPETTAKRKERVYMLYDSHTHINHDTYTEEERAEVIKAIEASDVAHVNDIGFDLASSRLAAEHAAKYPWCHAAVGVHPHDAKNADEMTLSMIRMLASKPGVVAIGEIGLDFHYDYSPRDEQRAAFREQIRMALDLKMPIVIHSREADQETMDILKEEGAFSETRTADFPDRPVPQTDPSGDPNENGKDWSSAKKDARVLLHCYSGSAELAEQYVRLGGWISLAGPVTFKNNKKTIRVAQSIPEEFLMVETDAPFLTPEPFRGRPNTSPYVEHNARRVGVLKGIAYEDICRITMQNAKRFFGVG